MFPRMISLRRYITGTRPGFAFPLLFTMLSFSWEGLVAALFHIPRLNRALLSLREG